MSKRMSALISGTLIVAYIVTLSLVAQNIIAQNQRGYDIDYFWETLTGLILLSVLGSGAINLRFNAPFRDGAIVGAILGLLGAAFLFLFNLALGIST